MTKNNTLALFDFDGTITRKDTFIEFIKFTHTTGQFWLGMFLYSPVLVAYKLKWIPNYKAKMQVFNHFFGNWEYEKFKRLGDDFCKNELPSILKQSALDKIKYHQQENHRIILVTASPKEWVLPWCKEMGIELISTEIEVVDQKITGKLATLNCYGPEKANRIKSHLNIEEFSNIYAYGDSEGDKEMLALAQHPHYKYFKD